METQRIGSKWLYCLYAALFIVLPWSAEVDAGSWRIRLPSEILSLLAGAGLIWTLFRHPEWLQRLSGNRRMLWAAVLWIIWLTISLLCSTLPVVSFKYWLVETGQWWVFFGGFIVFPDWWRRLLPLFIWSMGGCVLFTLAHHFQYNFRADQSMLAPMPFFPDHTLYSAVLVMLLPGLLLVFRRSTAGILFVLFGTGLFFAHCRAAWLSAGATVLLALPLIFLENRKWLLLLYAALFLAATPLKPRVWERAQQDVSMLERFNRYACSLRMSEARPLTGFGPGTFQFQYLSFQKPEEMTRISITDPARDIRPDQYGRGGGAHSEYFQALAENGWPGLLIWLFLCGITIFTGIQVWLNPEAIQNKDNQWFVLAITLSLFSFFFHAIFNNFLHDGRVALLFWGQIAMLDREKSG